MKSKKLNPDFLHIGKKIIKWYSHNSRNLPFRETKDPYKIWICEIIFQQTRIEQGMNHYLAFIERFPNVDTLYLADLEEVLLYWKGLGYYSRAINIHKAAQQIMTEFGGVFPENHQEIISLKGIGKYTAAAISSICFNEPFPAIDGNLYRVLSRFFTDEYDCSLSTAFSYFSSLAMQLMPLESPGVFNQAMMDLGSEICKPKNPKCNECPLHLDCIAFKLNKTSDFPVKTKKVKVTNLNLSYYFVIHQKSFLVKQREDDFIWKKLFEFPNQIPAFFEKYITNETLISHQLTHIKLKITISTVEIEDEIIFNDFAKDFGFVVYNYEASQLKSFPKPLDSFIQKLRVMNRI